MTLAVIPSVDEIRIDVLVDTYLRFMNEVRSVRRNTDRTSASTLRAFARHFKGRTIHDITTEDLIGFVNRPRLGRHRWQGHP